MTARPPGCPGRRGLLAAAGSLAAAAAAAAAGPARAAPMGTQVTDSIPFWGSRQTGILLTPQQTHTYFATLDLTASAIGPVVRLLKDWTEAAARLCAGQTARPMGHDASQPPPDSGETTGLAPARLTITFGFGAGLFTKDGKDRYGLAAKRPAALVDMPRFNGDQMVPGRTGGDLSIQASADDPQVAFHAVRQLAAMAYGVADMRWAQSGFLPDAPAGTTPRNLMGFKDGTQNPTSSPAKFADAKDQAPRTLEQVVWAGEEGPAWMRGGSYLVARRIRIALEHWDRTELDFQEEVMGRHKLSGAPLGGKDEFDPLDLDAADKDGNPVIAENAHVRLASPATNDGAQILRRAYSFNDGVVFTAERWPPWRQAMEYDAGLFFLAYQADPRTGFIKIFENMAKYDAMNQYTTHVGGGLFACPPGAEEGGFIGQALFESA